MPSLTNTQSQPVARPLNRQDYKTLALSSLGGTLEFYDFVIFVFYAKIISQLFFPSGNQFLALMATLGLFAAGYLARPLGGIIMAHYGDKIGRKRMFSLSIFMMALPTLVIGSLPTYATIGIVAPLLLLLMRILQGAAIGGEMPGAWVFIAEHTPKQRYGLGIGILTSGITGGILLGSMIAISIEYHFSEQQIVDFAWRIPFILGGLFGFISVYLRRFLEETPIFKELAAQKALCNVLPIKTVLTSHKQACLITAALTWSLSTAIIVIILMTPDVILRGIYHIDRNSALQANCVAVLMLTIGCILWGYLSDKIGSRITLLVAYSGLIISTSYFYYILSPSLSFLALSSYYAIMGFFVGAVVLTPIIATRAFPPVIRYSGLSFAYNIAYAIFGGLTPIITGFWLQQSQLAPIYYVSTVAILAILVGFLPLAYQGWQNPQPDKSNPNKEYQS